MTTPNVVPKKTSRRTTAELQEAFKAVAATLGIQVKVLSDKCRVMAIAEGKVIATITPSGWLRLAEKIAEEAHLSQQTLVPCDRACDKGIIHTKNSGDLKCFRCDGKGKQSPSDVERNRRYDLAHPDKANRKFEPRASGGEQPPPHTDDDNRGNR